MYLFNRNRLHLLPTRGSKEQKQKMLETDKNKNKTASRAKKCRESANKTAQKRRKTDFCTSLDRIDYRQQACQTKAMK